MAEPPDDWRALLGRKVSIRYALHGDASHPFSEAIGVVMNVDDDGVTEVVKIMTRHGGTTEVRASDILAAKVFPT